MANQWCSNQIKAISLGREAVGGTPTAAGGTPALPDAWGVSAEGQSWSIKVNKPDRTS